MSKKVDQFICLYWRLHEVFNIFKLCSNPLIIAPCGLSEKQQYLGLHHFKITGSVRGVVHGIIPDSHGPIARADRLLKMIKLANSCKIEIADLLSF